MSMMMKTVSTALLILLIFSCTDRKCGRVQYPVREADHMINPYLDYQPLPFQFKIDEWVGRKIYFKGTLSDRVEQHMVRPREEWKEIFTIDPDPAYSGLGQLLAYRSMAVPLDSKRFEGYHLRFYGSLGVLEGVSKRPGRQEAVIREYYLELTDIEGLWNEPAAGK